VKRLSGALAFVVLLRVLTATAAAQPVYDLLLKGGHVIDPANEINAPKDVAINNGRIARVAAGIAAEQARKTLAADGLYITPGLIDLHTHVYLNGRQSTLNPDETSLVTGATTVVDAGVSGWRTFDDFKKTIIDRATTRVLAMLNIAGGGMRDQQKLESNLDDMEPAKTAEKARQHPGVIVGIKTAHYGNPGFDALKRAVKAGRLAELPVMVDLGILSNSGRDTRTKLLDIMRPGDLHTHFYNDRQIELVDRFNGTIQPYMWEARRRGVLFDLGHGGGSFLWPVARKGIEQGFPPDTISTDLHPSSIMNQVSVPNCMSKLMALGMPLHDAVRRATLNPAKAIRKFPELGTLGEGRVADIAVLRLEEGVFSFKDSAGKKLSASRRLHCVMTIRDGSVVFDEDGLAFPEWQAAGEYEVIE
jgi:dihydroorotase